MGLCSHKKAYSFHPNAPQYCPDCDCYVDDNMIYLNIKLHNRKKKIEKILTKTGKY